MNVPEALIHGIGLTLVFVFSTSQSSRVETCEKVRSSLVNELTTLVMLIKWRVWKNLDHFPFETG